MGNHKEWRKQVKKLRRKRIRQQRARERDEKEKEEQLRRKNSPSYIKWFEEQKQAEEFQAQEEARIAAANEAAWLQREEEAQKQWRDLQEKLKLAWEERAKQNARIKEEWEREQKRLKELKEQKERELEEKLRKQEELKCKIEDFIAYGGEEPEELNVNFETNPDKPTCPFFQKTGACRFGDTCSRNHVRPGISKVLLIPNFYSHYSLETTETEYGNDAALEYENFETYEHFQEFFFDVLPEMERCGCIRQFKVCCNSESHLKGNVYVEYSSTREAIKSFQMFQGRWYGGKQLKVEFCNVRSWRSAICGLFFKKNCPKGSACNYLHVFRNPGNLFAEADKDKHRTPPRTQDIERSTPDTRHWRWSESPERLPLSYADQNSHGKSSKSRSKTSSSKSRSRRSSSRSRKRSSDSRSEIRRSHSGSRSKRSRRSYSRSKERSRSKSVEKKGESNNKERKESNYTNGHRHKHKRKGSHRSQSPYQTSSRS